MLKRLDADAYTKGVLGGDRVVLSRAITLIESHLEADKPLAQEVLENILPHTGGSVRVGITGVPGVGKSTFIEVFGGFVTALNKKIAVLAVDPTSQLTKGSIMGDKTRMEQLAHNPLAYIRPSPSRQTLGGVAHKTRETILLCEAAGFEVIVVETVGVGQSETVVKNMTDFFLLLMLAGAGDELQGIKRGIMEMADAIAITKADGNNVAASKLAALDYQNALHLYPPNGSGWFAPVLTCSAVNQTGIADLWKIIEKHQEVTKENGFYDRNRQNQNLEWMHSHIKQVLEDRFYENKNVKNWLISIENAVRDGSVLPLRAAIEALAVC